MVPSRKRSRYRIPNKKSPSFSLSLPFLDLYEVPPALEARARAAASAAGSLQVELLASADQLVLCERALRGAALVGERHHGKPAAGGGGLRIGFRDGLAFHLRCRSGGLRTGGLLGLLVDPGLR